MQHLLLVVSLSLLLFACTHPNKNRGLASVGNVEVPFYVPDKSNFFEDNGDSKDFFEEYDRADDKNVVAKIIKTVMQTRAREVVPDNEKFGAYLKRVGTDVAKSVIAEKVLSRADDGEKMDEGNSTFKLLAMLDWMRNNPINFFEQLRNSKLLNFNSDGSPSYKSFETAKLPNVDSYYVGKEADILLSTNKVPKFTNRTLMIVHNEDVREALNTAKFTNSRGYEDKVFSVALYNPKMDMTVGSEYMLSSEFGFTRKEKMMMRELMPRTDIGKIRKIARKYTKIALEESNVKGRIEVVNSVARRVAAEITRHYFGYNADIRSILRWSRATQKSFFHNPTNSPIHEKRAREAGKEMRVYLRAMINNYLKDPSTIKNDTIFRRLIEYPIPESFKSTMMDKKKYNENLDEVTKGIIKRNCETTGSVYGPSVSRVRCAWFERVVANMMGTLVGGIETTQSAIVNTIEFFLDNPSIMDGVVSEAKAGNHQAVADYTWEAMRFRPINPVVLRYTQKDYTFKSGRSVKRGDVVMLATQSAMFDEKVVKNPKEFILRRGSVNGAVNAGKGESRDNAYFFHLGNGSHKCLGDYVAQVLVPEVVMGVMAMDGLRRLEYEESSNLGQVDRRMAHIGTHDNIGAFQKFQYEDQDKSPLPEHLVLQTNVRQSRSVSIADPRFVFEDYLSVFDKNDFRICLSDIKEKAHKLTDIATVKNLKKWGARNDEEASKLQEILELDYVLYEGYYNRINAGAAFDLAFCRMPKQFRTCVYNPQEESMYQIGNRYISEYTKCEKHLTPREKYFYKTEILNSFWVDRIHSEKNHFAGTDLARYNYTPLENSLIPKRSADHEDIIKQRRTGEHKMYDWEHYVKFYDRTNHRQTYMNPTTKVAYPVGNTRGGDKLNFYTRVDLDFRKCSSTTALSKIGDAVKKAEGGYGIGSFKLGKKELSKDELNTVKNAARLDAYQTCAQEKYHMPDYLDKYMKSIFAGN